MPEAGLAVAGLSVRLGRRLVVDDVSFAAPAGVVTALLGPNGAGKSTILRAAAGLVPHAGRISVADGDAAQLSPAARARAVAYVPQASALAAPVPVRAVVAQGRFAHGAGGWLARPAPDERALVAAAMERTEVTPLADRRFSELSHGERRRVLIARALATAAPVLLLDEPTAGLDVRHALALLALLRRLADEGAAVVVVLHQLEEARQVAEQAVLLAGGKIHTQGRVADVLSPAPVRAVYGVDLVPATQLVCRLPEGG